MKRISLKPLWYIVIVSLLVSLNSGAFAQQNTTSSSVQTKDKTSVQQKPRLQGDTARTKPNVKPTPGTPKDKIPTPDQTGKTQGEKDKNTQKTWEDDQTTGTKESPKQKDAIDVKGEKTTPREESVDVKGDNKESSGQPTHYEHHVEKDQQGNAYGKNKGDLQGKEFGQERAEQARLSQETKSKELNETILQGEEKVKEARERIRVAKEKLEQDKKEGRISDQVFQERKERISKAEQALSELEVSIEKGKTVTAK